MADLVQLQVSGGIARLRMDDGKVNALSPEMLSELSAGLDAAERDGAVVLLQGRHGVFSAGFDLKVLRGGGEAMRRMLRQGFELAERLLSFPTPVVVACSGHALAMGSFLLLSADYRLGAEGPFKIGANEVAIGLTVPTAAIVLCKERLSPTYLSRVLTTAEILGVVEGKRAGFLDRIVDPAELAGEAEAVAEGFASLDMRAHYETKMRARSSTLSSLHQAIEEDDALLASL